MGEEAGGPRLVETAAEMRAAGHEARGGGRRLGFVPTLGALHRGHLSLIDRAGELCDRVAISVFVNPTQFAPDEDYEEYPRDLDRDLRLAGKHGVDVLFAPGREEMYPERPQAWVVPGSMGDRLDGASRPDHFRGVLTVVAKLFNIVGPDVAVFGRKDFQQSVLVRRMVRDLNMPLEVDVAPIVREEDGLAVSSRNQYLDEEERRRARAMPDALRRVRKGYREGERSPDALIRAGRSVLAEAGAEIDYLEIVDPRTLEPVSEPAAPESVCAVAARVGETRLIDNASLAGPSTLDD